MKESKLSFADGFMGTEAKKASGSKQMYFDWNKAASLIKEYLVNYPELNAEAGLQGDWAYTGGNIFKDRKPNNEDTTYLSSNWAIPTLIIENNGVEIAELACFTADNVNNYTASSQWDEESLTILGIQLG